MHVVTFKSAAEFWALFEWYGITPDKEINPLLFPWRPVHEIIVLGLAPYFCAKTRRFNSIAQIQAISIQ